MTVNAVEQADKYFEISQHPQEQQFWRNFYSQGTIEMKSFDESKSAVILKELL